MTGWSLDHSTFALFVHAHRAQVLRLSIRAAAPLAGLSVTTLSRAENAMPVSAGHVLRLCLWIGANPFWFLTDPATGKRMADPPEAPVSRETASETP